MLGSTSWMVTMGCSQRRPPPPLCTLVEVVAGLNSNVVDDDNDAARVGDCERDGGDSGVDGGGGGNGGAAIYDVSVCNCEWDGGDSRTDGGGGVASLVMLPVVFFNSTNRRSLSANGGVIRLRDAAAFILVLSISSYAARSFSRLVLIYRQEKRHTSLVTVSNITITCVLTGYGRSDRAIIWRRHCIFQNLSSNAMTSKRKM